MRTEAGFFSFFGDDVYAQATSLDDVNSYENSQTVALLEASVSSVSVLKNKDIKSNPIDENIGVSIVSDSALLPATGPLGVSDGTDIGDVAYDYDQVSVYVVRSGDSISAIAEMFDVSTNTILWANDLKKGQKLVVGDTLIILPVSGVQHIVSKGQTLKSIAKLYKVEVSDITNFNGLSEGDTLTIGEELIIPDGVMANEGSLTSTSSGSSSQGYYATGAHKNVNGYFINPVPGLKRKSQGLHGPGRRGIDLAAPTGTSIYASASGTVLLARSGYNGGYGNMVIIQHPNGTKTLYAHMSKITTSTGLLVSQRDLIGYVGSTGKSTGPHLHFEVFNAKNPGADWSWAN